MRNFFRAMPPPTDKMAIRLLFDSNEGFGRRKGFLRILSEVSNKDAQKVLLLTIGWGLLVCFAE